MYAMTILILNASPRQQGNVSRMLLAMKEEAKNANVQVDEVNIQDLYIRPCTGCMVCREKSECRLPEDDAQRVLCKINSCNLLVIGAPCYWGNMPGTLKLLFDRIVYGLISKGNHGFPRPLHKGKHAILVTACTTVFPFNWLFNQSRGTINSIRSILKLSGFKIAAIIEKGGTGTSLVGEKELAHCRKAIRRFLKRHDQF